jgi:O-antigen/teichoic acid export membrane protein
MPEVSQGHVSIHNRMSFWTAMGSWLQRNRTSVRMAFILRMVTMTSGIFFSLIFTRLLLRSMGDSVYGLFISFQGITRLGGLGDLGLSGAVALIVNMRLGKEEDDHLRELLASARTLFLFLAFALCAIFAVLSPWLPLWTGFREVPGSGSLPLLFACGGLTVGTFVLAGYFAALNYAHGTVMWPIIPGLILSQILAPFLHWRLAVLGTPLWVQFSAYVFVNVLLGLFSWLMLKWSHAWLGDLRPLQREREHWKKLATFSGWSYLASLGGVIYFVSDRLVINAWMGPAIIPSYQSNYKVCELGVTLAVTASVVGFPKITRWIASNLPADKERVRVEMNRLNAFQTALGCGIALGYLVLNDWFIRFWLGSEYNGPWAWQAAFAANLVITTAGQVGMQANVSCGENALRRYGIAVGGTGLLNLGLSIVAAYYHSAAGVATATNIAQFILSISANWYVAGFVGLPRTRWMLKTCIIPTAIIVIAALLRLWIPPDGLKQIGILFAAYAVLFFVICTSAGFNWRLLRSELDTLRGMVRR